MRGSDGNQKKAKDTYLSNYQAPSGIEIMRRFRMFPRGDYGVPAGYDTCVPTRVTLRQGRPVRRVAGRAQGRPLALRRLRTLPRKRLCPGPGLWQEPHGR